MNFNTPTSTVLYSIEKAIKAYRKLCSKNISAVLPDLTLDQALILLILDKTEGLTQMEIAKLVFKDYASITRILALMQQKNYINKGINSEDRRRSVLEITTKGKEALVILAPIISLNRETALNGISAEEQQQLYGILNKITTNCNE